MLEIPVTKTSTSRLPGIDFSKLEFGRFIADHMFVADYAQGEWQSPAIVPFGNISISPTALGLHYGQTVFEGMKAFLMKDGGISIFRMEKHHARFNKSLERLCMPAIPEDLFYSAIHRLVETDKDWIPKTEEHSLYLRPFVFATEAKLGVKISEQYKFIIVTSPTGPFYSKPLRVMTETKFARAAEQGTGFAKCGGNYGGAFYPSLLARQKGYDQVLWTDSLEHRYFDEAGTMNLMFVIDGKLYTPPLSSTILDGVTRDSILQIAKDLNFPLEERPVSLDEVKQALHQGTLTELFGTGTAAVVSPIKIIHLDGTDYELPEWKDDCLMLRAKKMLADIRTGALPDNHGWNYII